MSFIQFQFRRGTAAEWTTADPVLANGEPGLETDSDRFKIGDGITVWSLLPYWNSGGGIPDAPIDGEDYVRKDASWVIADYFSGSYTDLTNVPTFATVAFTGDYNDLSNTPVIPTELDDLTDVVPYGVGQAGFALAVNTTGSETVWLPIVSFEANNILTDDTNGSAFWDGDYADLINEPQLAPVATSGDYDDLINTPPPFVPTTFTGAGTTGYVPDPTTEQNFYLRDDGTFAPAPVSPVGGAFFNMRWDSATTATDPGDGNVKVNNADQPLATELYASTTTVPGNDASIIWDNLLPGEYIGIWETTGDKESQYYVVTGPVVDNGSWVTVPISAVPGGGVGGIDNNQAVQVFFIANPNEKIPTGGTTGQALVKQSNADFDTEWATIGGGGGIPDAPIDGEDYVRKDAAWVIADYFSGSYTDLTNVPTFATVAFTGNYNDLTSAPLTPVGATWNLTPGTGLFVPNSIQAGNILAGGDGGIQVTTELVNFGVMRVANSNGGTAGGQIAVLGNGATPPVWQFQNNIGQVYFDQNVYFQQTAQFPNLTAPAGTTEMMTVDAAGFVGKAPIPGGGGDSFWAASGNNIYNTNTSNVGINTTSPSEQLDVDGRLRVRTLSLNGSSDQPVFATSTGVLSKGIGYVGSNTVLATFQNGTTTVTAVQARWVKNGSQVTVSGLDTVGGSAFTRVIFGAGLPALRSGTMGNGMIYSGSGPSVNGAFYDGTQLRGSTVLNSSPTVGFSFNYITDA